MASLCKFYKKQRFVSYNNGLTWQPLQEFERGDLYEANSPSCNDGSMYYQWVPIDNGYICDGKDRYTREIYQVSYDGEYWYNMFPTVYRKGTLVESNSPFCDNAGNGQYTSGGTDPTSGETSGTTNCPEGYVWNGSECVCPTALDENGECIICQKYESFNSTTNECECHGKKVDGICTDCPPNSSWDDNTKDCECHKWYRKEPDGTCFYIDPLKTIKCEGQSDGVLSQSEVNYYENGWSVLSYEIGDCITKIDNNAFNGQISMTSVTIPDTVTWIGRLAFANCRSLPNITIPSGVTYMGDNMFVGCSLLKQVDFRNSLNAIPNAMFANCVELNSADWLSYNNIVAIGSKAFKNCYSLTSVTLSQSLTSIGDNAFEGCRGLSRIEIPSGVTSIGQLAFSQCSNLTSVTFNSSSLIINPLAFFNCKRLLKMVFTSTTPPTLQGNAFGQMNNFCIFIVPCEAVNTYKSAWPEYADRIQCNDTDVFYRWVSDDGIYCDGYDEYTRLKKQQTTDAIIWTDVVPATYKANNFITQYSKNCNYRGDVALTVYGQDERIRYYEPCISDERWVNLDPTEDWYCSGSTKYYKQQKEVTYDGITYFPASPAEYRMGEVYETSSSDCDWSYYYTELEYIENKTRAYIDTGFKPNQDTRIVCEMQTVTSTSYGRFVGCGGYADLNAIQFDYETGANGILHISWGAVAAWTTYSSCVGDYNKHTYDWDKNYFYRDRGESNQFSASTTYTSFQCTDNLGIFNFISNNREGDQPLLGKLYSFKIYDNGTLIRDLVPCKRNSDNVVGLYDMVNDTFYSSPNSSTFVGGLEV